MLSQGGGAYSWKPRKHLRAFRSLEFANSKFSNERGTKELKKIFGYKAFPYPKPISLIKNIIDLFPKKDVLVLDFFAGSGTTAHAVLQLNREDNGKRKFILVTNNENNIALNVTYERLHRIIFGTCRNEKTNSICIQQNKPFLNASLRVFNIKHYDVKTNQMKKLDEIKIFALKNLKKLNSSYVPTKIQVYYDLDGLNPYNEVQKNQKFSTNKWWKYKNKFYCICGKSFKLSKDLNNHLEKDNS